MCGRRCLCPLLGCSHVRHPKLSGLHAKMHVQQGERESTWFETRQAAHLRLHVAVQHAVVVQVLQPSRQLQ